jgi:hypothetical protein
MRKKSMLFKKNKIIILIFLLFSFLALGRICYAASLADLLSKEAKEKIGISETALGQKAGFDDTASIPDIISTVISTFLSLLGIIFVILMIYGGYNWMTAAGDESKVTKAKETITRAIIGLIITVSAYAITYFVFTALG